MTLDVTRLSGGHVIGRSSQAQRDTQVSPRHIALKLGDSDASLVDDGNGRPNSASKRKQRRGAAIAAMSSCDGQSHLMHTKAVMDVRNKTSQKYLQDKEKKREARAKALWEYIETSLEEDLRKKRIEYAEKVMKQRQIIQENTDRYQKKMQESLEQAQMKKRMARKVNFEKRLAISKRAISRVLKSPEPIETTLPNRSLTERLQVDDSRKSPVPSLTARKMEQLDTSKSNLSLSPQMLSRNMSGQMSTARLIQLNNDQITPQHDKAFTKFDKNVAVSENDHDKLNIVQVKSSESYAPFKSKFYFDQARDLAEFRHREAMRQDARKQRQLAIKKYNEETRLMRGIQESSDLNPHTTLESSAKAVPKVDGESKNTRRRSAPKFASEQEYFEFKDRYQRVTDGYIDRSRLSRDDIERLYKKALDQIIRRASNRMSQSNVMFETAEKNKAKLASILSGKPNAVGVVSSISKGWLKRQLHAITETDPIWNPLEDDYEVEKETVDETREDEGSENMLRRDSVIAAQLNASLTGTSLSASMNKARYSHTVNRADTFHADTILSDSINLPSQHESRQQTSLSRISSSIVQEPVDEEELKKQQADKQIMSVASSKLANSRHGTFAYHVRKALAATRKGNNALGEIKESIYAQMDPEISMSESSGGHQYGNESYSHLDTVMNQTEHGINNHFKTMTGQYYSAENKSKTLKSSPLKEPQSALENEDDIEETSSVETAQTPVPEKILEARRLPSEGLAESIVNSTEYKVHLPKSANQKQVNRSDNLRRPPWSHLSVYAVSEFAKTIPSKSMFCEASKCSPLSTARQTSQSWLKKYESSSPRNRDASHGIIIPKRLLHEVSTKDSTQHYELQRMIQFELNHTKASKVLHTPSIRFWAPDHGAEKCIEENEND